MNNNFFIRFKLKISQLKVSNFTFIKFINKIYFNGIYFLSYETIQSSVCLGHNTILMTTYCKGNT